MIIQIYEAQTVDQAEMLIELGVDHIGSVILSEEAWKSAALRDTISRIGASSSRSSLIPLFSSPEALYRTLDYYRPHIVHFCENLVRRGRISEICPRLIRLQENVRKRFPEIRIMRSIPIPESGKDPTIPVLELGRMFEAVSDFFLIDTLLVETEEEQPVEGFIGITGRTCDWETAAQLVEESQIPVLLGGGISPENAKEAIRKVAPAGIDSCTRTNVLDAAGRPIRFMKDPDRVKQLVAAVRGFSPPAL